MSENSPLEGAGDGLIRWLNSHLFATWYGVPRLLSIERDEVSGGTQFACVAAGLLAGEPPRYGKLAAVRALHYPGEFPNGWVLLRDGRLFCGTGCLYGLLNWQPAVSGGGCGWKGEFKVVYPED